MPRNRTITASDITTTLSAVSALVIACWLLQARIGGEPVLATAAPTVLTTPPGPTAPAALTPVTSTTRAPATVPSASPKPTSSPVSARARSSAASTSTLRQGDTGPEVEALQRRLLALGFWMKVTDGRYDIGTAQAVTAFQKALGMPRDGVAGPKVRAALATADRPRGQAVAGDRVEVDLRRQLVLLVRDGRVGWALTTSTGAAGTPTPKGRFTVHREVDGVRKAELGDLYRPRYFEGGVALHGARLVPATAASHGCVRLPNAAMDLLWSGGFGTIGTEVWVY